MLHCRSHFVFHNAFFWFFGTLWDQEVLFSCCKHWKPFKIRAGCSPIVPPEASSPELMSPGRCLTERGYKCTKWHKLIFTCNMWRLIKATPAAPMSQLQSPIFKSNIQHVAVCLCREQLRSLIQSRLLSSRLHNFAALSTPPTCEVLQRRLKYTQKTWRFSCYLLISALTESSVQFHDPQNMSGLSQSGLKGC